MCSKGQLQKGDGVIRLGYTVFSFAMRVYATLEGLFLISSIAAMISFSSGTVMIPAARKRIVIGTCFFPSGPTTLLKISIFFIGVFTSVGVSSVMSVHFRVGFDPAGNADGNDPHIALNNIKKRLKMTCDGKMTIAPRDGGGTSVKVTIPLAKPE